MSVAGNEQERVIEEYVWSDAEQDYVLLYRGTDEQEAKRLRRSFLCKQTRARHKREREERENDGGK